MKIRVIEERQENHQGNEIDKRVREKIMEDRQRNNIHVVDAPEEEKKKVEQR